MCASRSISSPVTETRGQRSWLEAWLGCVVRHPWAVLLLCALLALAALAATRAWLGVNSDPIAMLDEELPFRQTDAALKRNFPQFDTSLLVVIEAPTPEQAGLAARRVEQRLLAMPGHVEGVTWPAGSEFFADHGLLFLPMAELETLADRLTEAQPLLGRLAGETSSVALLDLLTRIAERADSAPPGFDAGALYRRVADALDAALDDRPALLSWQHLLGDAAPGAAREILVVNPVLDHDRVLAARGVMQALAALRTEMGLDSGPVRMRLTGSSALRFEEMKSVIDGAALTGVLALVLVNLVMLAGLRSVRLSLIALVNLVLGLVLATGFAALAVGRVNPISVSFVVLYIGLGVNYAVHYLLRYRELVLAEPAGEVANLRAIVTAGRFLARPLLLSAVTTALGFFAFVPTSFSGIAQLGLIAGFAMGITLLLSYTALPAMLAIIRPRPRGRPPEPDRGWRRALEWPLAQRGMVLFLGLALIVAAAPTALRVGFDSDPLNVRDPESESVLAIRELLESGEAGYRNIQVLVPPGADPEPLRARLAALDTVARAETLSHLLPDDQDDKLMLIEDLGWLLGPAIIDADWQADPVTPEALVQSAEDLREALVETGGEHAADLADALDRLTTRLETDAADLAGRVNQVLVGGMPPTLGRLSRGLGVDAPVERDSLPEWLERQWIGQDGTRMIQLYPAVDVQDRAAQNRFAEQVVAVAGGQATGGPIIQQAAGQAITAAFRQALAWAVAGIALVLLITLRSARAAAMVMAPLTLGGLLTLAAMVVLGVEFNFANVVALPLLLGVAVDNGIHLVTRHRAGLLPDGNVLKSATARAIVVGALITAGGFGNLAFSPHAGTASLGLILAVGLALMVIATLVFLPAMLGRCKQ